jgi:HAD superfamily hydrolase (TIGR01509 family)
MEIKAAIFDMDGTLVDSLMLWDVLWADFGKTYLEDENFRPSEADDKCVRTLTLKDAMHLIHENYHIGRDGGELLDRANRMMIDFYSNRVALKDGVIEFLEHCKQDGVKMCLATATATDLLHLALDHCGIGKYFSGIFSCTEIGKGKDHPDVFLLAQKYLGEEVGDTWVVEDSLVAIETATKIGMKTIGIYDRFNYGQDRIKEIATEYIAEGQTLARLIE